MANLIMQLALYLALFALGFFLIYLIGKRLIRYSESLDKESIKEAYKEAYMEMIDLYWPKINQMLKEGFAVATTEENSKSDDDSSRDRDMVKENHPEFFKDGNDETFEIPVQRKL